MGRVLVVTDSSACVPADSHPRLRVLPITIVLPQGERTDSPAAAADVYAAIAGRHAVRSVPPSAHDYVKAIEEGDFAGAVVITPAREFTVRHRHAELAARLTDRPVEVIDCRTAAAAQGLLVRAALQVRSGSVGRVAAAVREAMARVALVAVLPSQVAVSRNASLPRRARGRVVVNGPAVFRFHDGTVSHVADLLPDSDPVDALRQAWGASGTAVVFHADEPVMAEALGARVGAPVVPFSPAMALHTGPGWLGIAWLR